MMTVFNQGQEVYDEVFFPNRKLTISKINYQEERIEICEEYYDFEGYRLDDVSYERVLDIPTLSTKSYSLKGFEQKSNIPTYKIAEKWYKEKYHEKVELEGSLDAIKKLYVLRDYYNNSWIPDYEEYFYIGNFFGGDFYVIDSRSTNYDCEKRFLAFKTKETATRFLNEQKELLEIAKSLL